MAKPKSVEREQAISRDRLAELLNEDLSREYQAIIGYVVYSQVLKGAAYMNIADQLEIHAKQELDHALIISRQIDYLGKMPVVTPKPVRTSEDPKQMLRFDLYSGGRRHCIAIAAERSQSYSVASIGRQLCNERSGVRMSVN
jgi:bacterioferritin